MSERFLDKLFQAFEDTAVEQQQAAPIVTPVDGDDYTYTPQTVKNLLAAALGLDESLIPDTAYRHQFSYERQPDGTWQYRRTSNGETVVVPIGNTDEPLTYAALVKTVYRLQNEVAGLAAQVVEANAQVVEAQRSIIRMIELQEKQAINTLGTAQILQSLGAQVVELRERLERWEADS